MSFYIQSYLYSEGPASSGSYTPDLATSNTIFVNEGGANYYARTQMTLLFDDALTAWETELNSAAGLSGTYSVSYNTTTNRVTISSNVSFSLGFIGNTATILGFSSNSYASATSRTGEQVPAGKIKLLGRTMAPAEHGEQVEVRTYRHQRALSIGWGNMQIFKIKLFFTSDQVPALLPKYAADKSGYCLTGRVRITGLDSGAYSPTNVDGYTEGYVVTTEALEAAGDTEGFFSLSMVLGVLV